MTFILAIDPGPTESAWVMYSTHSHQIMAWAKETNQSMIESIDLSAFNSADVVAIEKIASYGAPVGETTFTTCIWIGRFIQALLQADFHAEQQLITRVQVKQHLCHRTAGVNDAVIRQALIDRFGPSKEQAIGRKDAKGPLYGLKGDGWAALAVAVTVADGLTA